jgi:hypothetical protein
MKSLIVMHKAVEKKDKKFCSPFAGQARKSVENFLYLYIFLKLV